VRLLVSIRQRTAQIHSCAQGRAFGRIERRRKWDVQRLSIALIGLQRCRLITSGEADGQIEGRKEGGGWGVGVGGGWVGKAGSKAEASRTTVSLCLP
jgi:hypothetical protein